MDTLSRGRVTPVRQHSERITKRHPPPAFATGSLAVGRQWTQPRLARPLGPPRLRALSCCVVRMPKNLNLLIGVSPCIRG
jgi:hypothetical protein